MARALRARRAIALVLLLGAGATGAGAPATAGAVPAASPMPLCCVPNSAVNAVALSGSTLYFGGEFRHVSRYTGGFAALDPVSAQLRDGWPIVDGTVFASLPDGAGGWYIGGSFTAVGGVPRANLAHIRADGTLDPAWAPSTDDGGVAAMAAFGSSIFVGGFFTTVGGGTARAGLAAFDRTSGAVTSFSAGLAGGGTVGVSALGVMSGGLLTDSRLFVGGQFGEAGGQPRTNLAAFDLATGALDAGFAPTLDGTVRTLLVRDNDPRPVFSDWTIYAGGPFTSVDGTLISNHLAAFQPDGDLKGWSPTKDLLIVYTLAGSGTTIYAGGADGVAAFDQTTGAQIPGWNPSLGAFGQAQSILRVGDTVYVGGNFLFADGELDGAADDVRRDNLAAFDAATGAVRSWDPEASSNSSGVLTLGSDGASVFAGGGFVSAGGVERDHLAAFDLASGQLTSFNPNVNGPVSALALSGSTLFAGGGFTTVNGSVTRNNLAAFDTASGAATAFDPNVSGGVTALALNGDRLFAGGTIVSVNGSLPRTNLAAFDAVTGAAGSFAPALNLPVNALATMGETLYVGGAFTSINGAARGRLGAVQELPGTAGGLAPFDPDLNGTVNAIALDGPTLYAGGFFTTVAGGTAPRGRLAALDTTSGGATGWDPPDLDNPVLSLALGDGLVFVGGIFSFAGAERRSGLAAFDAVTGALSSWAPQPDADGLNVGVRALTTSPDGLLVVAGGFERLQEPPSPTARLAVFGLPHAASPSIPPGTGGRDTIAPLISRLRMTNRRFAVARGSTPRDARAKRGTAFRFALSEAARTTVAIARALPGRRRGKRCVKPRRGLRRKCTRYVSAVTLTRARTVAGPNRIAYTGRVGKRALRRGRYRATLTATDAAGNRSKPARVTFTVVRR